MGVIELAVKITIYSIIFIFTILIIPGIGPDINFEAYSQKSRLKFEGVLEVNSILDKAEPIVDGKVKGPESIAIRGDEIFTGIEGGKVIKIKGDKITNVAQFGTDCDRYWKEENCGRPLGLRFDSKGNLVVADAYLGIFEVNVENGSFKKLVSMDDEINGVKPQFPDDLDVGSDGNIYWSDASTKGNFKTMGNEIFGQPSGRLVKFDRKLNKSEVLIDNIHFPNGVQLSKDEDFVLVSELMRDRVWKYNLKGKKKGTKEIFVESLPGMPDNIRSNHKGGFLISLSLSDDPEILNFNVGEVFGPYPLVRKFILRTQSIILFFLDGIQSFYPSDFLERAKHYAQHMGPIVSDTFIPKKVTIIETDENGNILRSFQNKNGKIWHISETSVGETYTYFGSPSASKIWRMKTKDLYP